MAEVCKLCDKTFKILDSRHLRQHNTNLFEYVKNYDDNITRKNILLIARPDIAEEWDYVKNSRTPEDYTTGSRKKIHWKCKNGHEWEATIKNRVNFNTCFQCRSLAFLFPEAAKEWHQIKNEKSPQNYSFGSSIKVWWECAKGHEYLASIKHRTLSKSGCPYCAGKLPSDENTLMSFPKLVNEWHPTKNSKNPTEYTSGSKKKVWWLCKSGHEWKSAVHHRTGRAKSGCPDCYTPKFSKIEKRIAFELANFLVVEHSKVSFITSYGKKSADIYIPDLSLVVEYDGYFYHLPKVELDAKKTSILFNEGKTVIRLRTEPLEKITDYDILIPRKKENDAKYCTIEVLKKIEELYHFKFPTLDAYISQDGLSSEKEANQYIQSYNK